MPLLPGLIDTDVEIATPDMRRRAEHAAAIKDWRQYNQNRDALVLRFADGGAVRIPMGRMQIEELRRTIRPNLNPPVRVLANLNPPVRVLVDDDPKKVAEFAEKAAEKQPLPLAPRTCWDHLLEDEDSASF